MWQLRLLILALAGGLVFAAPSTSFAESKQANKTHVAQITKKQAKQRAKKRAKQQAKKRAKQQAKRNGKINGKKNGKCGGGFDACYRQELQKATDPKKASKKCAKRCGG